MYTRGARMTNIAIVVAFSQFVAGQGTHRRRQDPKARLVSEYAPSFHDSPCPPLWVNDYLYRHLSAGDFDFEDHGLLDIDDMDSRKASNNTLKSTNHQSDVDDIPGMLYKPVEVDRANTRQEAYYLHERLIAVTSILHPWPDHPQGVLGRPSEAAYGYKSTTSAT